MDIRGKRVLVVGLARSGLVAANWLKRHEAVVTVSDMRPPSAFREEIPELLQSKIGLELGIHQESTFLEQDFIVISPGVPADLPVLNAARQQGIPVVPEIEVAGWFLKGRLAGITGTNGKTTTTALLGKILEASGLLTFVGGNIGVPLLKAVDMDPPASHVVAELSSFQLETIDSFRPHVAVLLNLSPNHLDRHPNFDVYVAAKARVFRNQTPGDYAILNADDDNVMKLAPSIKSQKVLFSRRRELANGVFHSRGRILYRLRNLEVTLMNTADVRLRGEFNLENILAAAAAACVLGAEFTSIRRAVREFVGVEHRLEFVREVRGVDFYNDSKATSVDAAAKALSTFERGVHLILGGKDKGAPYAPLKSLLKDRVREVLVIGAAQKRIVSELSGAVDIVESGDLETAVRAAAERANAGEVVLLAPACSSFDQFENFEHRGRVFKQLVEKLAEESPAKRNSRKHNQGQDVSSVTNRSDLKQVPSVPKENPGCQNLHENEVASIPGEPEPLVLSSPRELEYVYEVGAEEMRVPGTGDFSEATDELLLDEDGLAPPDTVEDEMFAYEVRTKVALGGKGPASPTDAFVRAKRRKHRRTREVK